MLRAAALIALGVLAGAAAPDLSSLNRVGRAPTIVSDAGVELHGRLRWVDLHADTLLWGRSLLTRSDAGHVDLPRLEQGNVAVQVFSVVTQVPWPLKAQGNQGQPDVVEALAARNGWPAQARRSPLERAAHLASRLRDEAKASNGRLRLLRTPADLDELLAARARDEPVVGALLSLEGLQGVTGPADVERLHAQGFRVLGLAHFFDTKVSGSAHGVRRGGLTPLGRQALARMGKLGMAVDLAHASPAAFDEALALFRGPVLVSHTGVAATCPSPRNLTDAQLRAVAARGGVVGIGYWRQATCGDDVAAIVRALRHAVSVAGVDAVALGSDFDGAVTTPFDTSRLAELTDALLTGGFTPDEVRKLAGQNALRVLRQALVVDK